MAHPEFHSPEQLDQIAAVLKAGRTSEEILRNVDETLQTAAEGLEMLAEQRFDFKGPITFTNFAVDAELPTSPEIPTADMIRAMAYPLVRKHRRGIRIAITFAVATTHALQNLRSTEPDFNEWWAPRSRHMGADELCRYFYRLRSVLLKEGYLRATTANQAYRTTQGMQWVEVVTGLHGAPTSHRGEDITGQAALELLESYLGYIGEIVAEAWTRFCPGVDSTARSKPVFDVPMILTREDP